MRIVNEISSAMGEGFNVYKRLQQRLKSAVVNSAETSTATNTALPNCRISRLSAILTFCSLINASARQSITLNFQHAKKQHSTLPTFSRQRWRFLAATFR